MIEEYLQQKLPTTIAQQVIACGPTAESARFFVAGHDANADALNHFSVYELLENFELWMLGTAESQERQKWLEESYPKHIEYAPEIQKSILVCGKCHKRTVDYYEKQTRGADEPMTVFAHCLSCGKRWTQ